MEMLVCGHFFHTMHVHVACMLATVAMVIHDDGTQGLWLVLGL
jgi:hypothetical protein